MINKFLPISAAGFPALFALDINQARCANDYNNFHIRTIPMRDILSQIALAIRRFWKMSRGADENDNRDV